MKIFILAFCLFLSVCLIDGGVLDTKTSGGTADGKEKWAYVTVRPGAHMFYWLYHSYHKNGYRTRPLILWLQGGPGASSTGYGNFEIIGPLDLDLKPRNTTWVNQANILFVDNPVGAGYSYTEFNAAFTTNIHQISIDLTTVMKAFYADNPEFRSLPFYIFGQSYGGKMAAHFALHLHREVTLGLMDANVAGYAMGNAWISPIDSTTSWAEFLFWMSNVDEQGVENIGRPARQCRRAVDEGRWQDATTWWSLTEAAVSVNTNNVDFYNILNYIVPSTKLYNTDFGQLYKRLYKGEILADEDKLFALMNGEIRQKLGIIPNHVIWGAQYGDVFNYQEGDFMKPVVNIVDESLKQTNLKVIVYQGQLDLICDTKAAMDWVQTLTWNELSAYNTSTKHAYVEPATKQTEMFVKARNNFKFYWILQAGHSVPKDAPWTAYRMLERILSNQDV